MFTSARDVTCISHNTCLHRPQRRPILGPASATHLYMSATIPVYIGQSCGLCRPQHLFTSANTGTCIGHITCIYMSATIPVYVGQSCDLHRPQYVPTSATTSVYVGQHWDLRRPHNCPGHWPVAFPDSQGPGNPTGSAQCASPRNGSSWHSVMALCGLDGYRCVPPK